MTAELQIAIGAFQFPTVSQSLSHDELSHDGRTINLWTRACEVKDGGTIGWINGYFEHDRGTVVHVVDRGYLFPIVIMGKTLQKISHRELS